MTISERVKVMPLAVVALAAASGIYIAEHLPAGSSLALIAVAVAVTALAWSRRDSVSVLLAVGISFAAFHAVTMQDAVHHDVRRLLLSRPSHTSNVIAIGRVEKALRRDLPGAQPGAAWFHATELKFPVLGKTVRGLVMIKLLPGRTSAPTPGTYVVEGRLRLPLPAENPGQFDAEDYELHRGLASELVATKLTCQREDIWNFTNWLDNAAEASRQWIKTTLSGAMEDAPDERTVTLAMVIGGAEANASAEDLEKPFRETGTIHVFAVAGLHVGIVAYILWMLLRPLGLSRSALLLVLIPALFGYAFLTGLRPSSVRAAVMASVFFSGALFNRRSSVLNSLGGAALIMLVFDTNELFSIGFQMSFSVIAAIGVCEPLLRRPFRRVTEPDPFMPPSLLNPAQRQWLIFKRWVVGLFTVSSAATIGSMPCLVGAFGLVTPVSILANIVLVPITFLVLFTASLRLGFALLHLGYLQLLLGHSNWLFARLALVGAKFFALLPGSAFYTKPPTFHPMPPAQITVLRMSGGGAAQHVHTADADWLLDCGAARDFKFSLRPYLQRQGVNHLSGLILSHGDSAHIGATGSLLAEFPVAQVHESVLDPWPWSSKSSASRRLHASGIKPTSLTAGDSVQFSDSLQADVLHPSPDLSPRVADDRSLILLIHHGPFRILWCNDAGFITEKTLLEKLKPEQLRADIIIRNQHPKDFSMLPEFIDAVHPRCIISSNSDFPAGEQIPEALRNACAERKIRLFDQAKTDAVILELWQDRIEVRPFRSSVAKLILTPRP